MEKKKVPMVPWFTYPSDEPHLIGSKCNKCGANFFPKLEICRNPNCRSKDVSEYLFSRTGKIWSWVVQQASPPPPFPKIEPYAPYALIEVKFPEGNKIMGIGASDVPLDSWEIGMQVETVVEKFYDDKDGNEVVTWKFRPVAGKTPKKK